MLRSATAALLLSLCVPARAQAPSPSPYAPGAARSGAISSAGSHTGTEHQGFYFNFTLGAASLRTSGSYDSGSSLSARGGGVQFAFGVGGAVAPGVILAAHLYGVTSPSTTVTLDGVSVKPDQYNLVGLGPSLILYAMPSNLYLQITPAVSRTTMSLGGGAGGTERGLGVHVGLGGEWYLAPRWGLGLVAFFEYASNKDADGRLKTSAFGAALSLTSN